MNLDEKDVEAVAKARVSREENNKTNRWMVGSVIAIVGGVLVVSISRILGWVVSVGGFVSFIWYMNTLNKKQGEASRRLLAEWNMEQRQAENPQVTK